MTDSSQYYNTHAEQYVKSTAEVDMSEQYAMFLPHLTKGSSILDAGCGSGRDSLYFKQRGYTVQAFDASEAMVESTRSLAQIPVRKLTFLEMDYDQEFDGIWACASLLHVPKQESIKVFSLLAKALKPKGFLYCSFKNREESFEKDGRIFSCFTPESMQEFIQGLEAFKLIEMKLSTDVRPGREDEGWVNVVMQKR
ncbi:MAG: class I SAM-dependent methyltransferase [Sphaerochaeta sp.]|nr:class I SAM-dependent methyltransferase [Sphaerochaeta sp.]